MGNKDFRSNSNVEIAIPDIGNNKPDTEKRFPQLNGYFVHTGYKYNNFKMGEVVKAFLNTIGFTVYLLGILANLNNIIAVLLGVVGLCFGIIKALHANEVWRIKRVERKKVEDDYNKILKL